MSKAPAIIEEAMHRSPDNYEQQVAFFAEAMRKLIERQLGQYEALSEEDAFIMVVDLLDALQLPEGPLYIPGEEENPLIESVEELHEYVEKQVEGLKEEILRRRLL